MRRFFLILGLLGLFVASDPAKVADATPTTTSALYKVTLIRSEGPPVGGINVNVPRSRKFAKGWMRVGCHSRG